MHFIKEQVTGFWVRNLCSVIITMEMGLFFFFCVLLFFLCFLVGWGGGGGACGGEGRGGGLLSINANQPVNTLRVFAWTGVDDIPCAPLISFYLSPAKDVGGSQYILSTIPKGLQSGGAQACQLPHLLVFGGLFKFPSFLSISVFLSFIFQFCHIYASNSFEMESSH